jgi:preprotein translocase subunit SecD
VAPPRRGGPRPVRALALLAVVILIMLISITGKETFNPGKWHQQFKVGLGLDLSSGTEVVLQAHTAKGVPSTGAMQQAISVLLSRVNGTGNSGAQVQQQGADLINVSIPGQPPENVLKLVSTTAKMSFRPVLLVEPYTGAATSSPAVKPSGSATPSSTATPSASASTSASPKASTNALSEHLASPAATASATPKATTSATAKASTTPTATASATPSATASAPTTYGDASKVNAATMKLFDKLVCKPGPNSTTVNDDWKPSVGYTLSGDQYDDTSSQIVSCDPSGMKYALGPAVFEGPDVTSVTTGILQNSTQWVVNITLNGKAAAAFGTLTTNDYNSYYANAQAGDYNSQYLDQTALVLDGDVQTAPEISSPITAGNVQITGPAPNGFTEDQANQLANILKFGSLPLSFTPLTVSTISAQLGHNSLDAGLAAGIIGLALVVIYMFCYYRGLGLVSVSSLLIAALLAYLAVVLLSRYQNYTMELSGIAGLVVAIGITADSFIVFFERLRDEVRDGKTLRPAVESGWRRARRTILVSDTVSFLAAVLLYHFAVSDVQGFAYTLGLTTLIDVLVVFLFTKPMVTLLAGTKFYGGGHRWSGLDPARLGARAPWRSGVRRTVRTQRQGTGSRTSVGSRPAPREDPREDSAEEED